MADPACGGWRHLGVLLFGARGVAGVQRAGERHAGALPLVRLNSLPVSNKVRLPARKTGHGSTVVPAVT